MGSPPTVVAGGVLLLLALPSCRDPTEIKLELSTDVQCADDKGTSITVGKLGAIEKQKPATTTGACNTSSGRIGSLVIVPSGDKQDDVAVRVVTGFGKSPEECVQSGYKGGCIVARRALHFISHQTLYLPIEMSTDCADVDCDVTETCFRGNCVPATIDPNTCTDPKGCTPSYDGGVGGSAGSGGSGGVDAGSGGSAGVSGSGGTAPDASTCQTPLADCDNNPANGCEIDLSKDSKNCGACTVDCLGAACTAGSCEPRLIFSVAGSATAIATDALNVYWTDPAAGIVWQHPLSGGSPIQLATGQAFAQGVTVDTTHVYFANWTNNGRVARVPIGGGKLDDLVPSEGFPADVSVDDQYAYFTAGNSQAGVIRRVLKSGGTPETLATGQVFPFGIGIDATHVFWANWTANGVINKIAKDGTGGVIAVTATEKSPYAVSVFAGNVYFTLYNAQGQVRRVEAQGANAASVLLAGGLSKPASVAVDQSGVWFTTEGDAVYYLPTGSQTPQPIVSKVNGLQDIAVGPKAVCWATGAGPVCKGK